MTQGGRGTRCVATPARVLLICYGIVPEWRAGAGRVGDVAGPGLLIVGLIGVVWSIRLQVPVDRELTKSAMRTVARH